jgi:hypothetical protein
MQDRIKVFRGPRLDTLTCSVPFSGSPTSGYRPVNPDTGDWATFF